MLTKSDLASFRQCPRRLWLAKNAPDTADTGDATRWRRARDGAIVGEKARELLGLDLVWPQSLASPSETARAAAKLLADAPDKPGVEIPLVRDDLSVRADALVPTSKGYVLQETKACTFPLKPDKVTPGKPDEHLLDDIAIQMWVLEESPLQLARAQLNLLNSRWCYPGGGDYRGLFRPLVLEDSIRERVAEVPFWLAEAKRVLSGHMPEVTTGKQCQDPHTCPFYTHCSGAGPERA
jgi:hypothetical protein